MKHLAISIVLALPLAGAVACVGDSPSAADASAPDSAVVVVDSATPTVDAATPADASPVLDASTPDAQDAAVAPYRVFLTAGTHDGAFGADPTAARTTANAMCATEAAAGAKTKPIGARVWRAMVAFGVGAKDAVKGAGPWVRPDGAPLGDLRPDGSEQPRALTNAPNMDANGTVVSGARAWVGPYDFVGFPTYPDCTYFTKTGNGALYENAGATADPGTITTAWAKDTVTGYVRACQEQHHIYCIEGEK